MAALCIYIYKYINRGVLSLSLHPKTTQKQKQKPGKSQSLHPRFETATSRFAHGVSKRDISLTIINHYYPLLTTIIHQLYMINHFPPLLIDKSTISTAIFRH